MRCFAGLSLSFLLHFVFRRAADWDIPGDQVARSEAVILCGRVAPRLALTDEMEGECRPLIGQNKVGGGQAGQAPDQPERRDRPT